MLDALSPLSSRRTSSHVATDGPPRVSLSTRPLARLQQIAGWNGFGAAAQPVLMSIGLTGIGDFRHAQEMEAMTVWRIAPDRLLIEGAEDLAGHASADLAVLDLSHARAVICVSGQKSRILLSQLFAVDASLSVFGPGQFIQTGIHGVGVLVHCTGDDAFDIFVPCTWAVGLWDYIHDNAVPLGVQVVADT